jgi:V/A-type H+/Na+-transporting ATPase subunit I
MISPMLKYSLLIYHREYEDILDELRELGVVHIMERELDVSDEIRENTSILTGSIRLSGF